MRIRIATTVATVIGLMIATAPVASASYSQTAIPNTAGNGGACLLNYYVGAYNVGIFEPDNAPHGCYFRYRVWVKSGNGTTYLYGNWGNVGSYKNVDTSINPVLGKAVQYQSGGYTFWKTLS